MIEGNLEEIEVEERSNGVIRIRFETLPRITVLSLAVFSTVLDFYLEISIGSHTNTVTATQKKSPIFSLSLLQIRSHTDLTALIEHKAGIYGPRPQTDSFESLKNRLTIPDCRDISNVSPGLS